MINIEKSPHHFEENGMEGWFFDNGDMAILNEGTDEDGDHWIALRDEHSGAISSMTSQVALELAVVLVSAVITERTKKEK